MMADDAPPAPARDPQDLDRLLVARQRAGDIEGIMALRVATQRLGLPAAVRRPLRRSRAAALGNAGGLTDFGVNLMHLPLGNCRASATGIRTKTNSSMCSKAS
jgi:hypothetical protein